MSETQEKKQRNFWLEGPVLLTDLPEIGNGLKLLLKHHPELKQAHQRKGILPWKKQPEGFEGLINIILAQQISTAVAAHLMTRLHTLVPEITPRRLLKIDDEKLRSLGISRQKIAYGKALAECMVQGSFHPDSLRGMDDDEAMEALTSLKGIGPWSAEIYLMFSLGRGDVWPAGDIALQKGLQNICELKSKPDAQGARKLGKKWAPHRSAASLIVWHA